MGEGLKERGRKGRECRKMYSSRKAIKNKQEMEENPKLIS